MAKLVIDNNRIFEKSTYVWILQDFFDLRKTYKRDVYFESPVFPEGDSVNKWKLGIFPHDLLYPSNCVRIFLISLNHSPIFTEYTLCFRNSNDQNIFEYKDAHTITKNIQDWKYYSGIPYKASLFACDIKIHVFVSTEVAVQNFNRMTMHRNSTEMAELYNLESMFENEEFTDFVIKFNDSSEKSVHRNILGARSSVFYAMFKHDTSEKKLGYVEITDISKNTMLQLLHFVYTGKIDELSNLSTEDVQKLLIAADKYAILDLKLICMDDLTRNFDLSNVLEILMLAEFHYMIELKNNAFDYILKHFKKFSDPVMFKKVVDKCPNLLAELVVKLTKTFEDK